MAKSTLTDRQRAILEFIQDRVTEHGQSPTIREIGARFAIRSTNGVRVHLNALVRKGFITKHALISRGIELARSMAGAVTRVPLVGSVPAGLPIDAIENVEGDIVVDSSFLPKGDTFTLRVKGDSMVQAGILDGDLVLVRKQQVARSGDIVVAVIGGEATVKRYMPQTDHIKLQPENPNHQPIIVDRRSREFRIAGKVIGLMRRIG